MQPVISVRNLSVERDAPILQSIDWKVNLGENWVILGANGSGKTSLLSALTGYLTPSEGEISVCGETYGESDWRELRRHVGLVSSSIRQQIDQAETGLETVVSGKNAILNFWGEITATDRRRALRLLREVECEYLADRSWLVLSQGERQRVLIARALMSDLKLLILDEPCAGLDPVAREKFLAFIERTASRPQSPPLVLVTHHVEEITPAFSHVLLLKAGRVIASGTKEQVLRSSILSTAFNASIRVTRRGERYALQITTKSKKVV